ncbi:MAG: AraC family transcriptional regulator [Clostridia bacterium]|nr:AraC family transcriptional regulator [Clostridia bacterium]
MRIVGSGTYRRILLILLISFETLLIVYAAFAFSASRYISQQEIENLNQQVVEKLSKNIQYMDDIVNKYTTMVINDNRLNTLLYSEGNDKDQFERIQALLHLRRMSESYGIIHSTIIYNGVDDMYYSWDELHTTDPLAASIKNKEITLTGPVWRTLPTGSYYNDETVLTYVMYGPFGTDGFVLVNVKNDWLENDLKNEGNDSRVLMVLNPDGSVVAHSRNSIYDKKIPDDLMKNLKDESGSFKYKDEEGKTHAAVYNSISDGQWLFLSLTLYDVMFSGLNKLGSMAIVMTLLFGLVGIIMVLFVGKRIYNPLRTIAAKAENVFGFKNSGDDEIDYLNSVIESESVLSRLNGAVMFKEVLLNGENDKYTFKKALSLSERLGQAEKLALIYIKAGRLAEVKAEFEELTCETVVMERGTTLVVIAEYGNAVFEVCDRLRQEDDVAVVCESEGITPDTDVSEVFKRLEVNASYRVVYGNVRISEETIRKNLANAEEFIYPLDKASRIMNAVNEYNIEQALIGFEDFLTHISQNSLNNFLVALTKLMLSLFEGSNTENPMRAGYMSKKILAADSRREIIVIFNEAFEEVIQSNQRKNEDKKEDIAKIKADRIVDAVKMIIDNSYENSFLCVAAIADEMKLSAGYIGKLFRQNTGMTVSDYINKIRMDEAARLLSSTNYTIKKVMEMVGYDNESTFYKKFKNHTGMTPKEFRVFNSDSSGFATYTID